MPLKHGWSRWKKRLLIVGLILVVVFGTLGVLWAGNVFGWRAWRVQEVQNFIGADIPTGATNVHFATQNQKTRIIWLRFDLPADADSGDFLSKAAGQTSLQSGFTPFPVANPQEAAFSWWDVQAATDFAGLYDNTGQKVIEILLDNSRNTVYVRAYTLSK